MNTFIYNTRILFTAGLLLTATGWAGQPLTLQLKIAPPGITNEFSATPELTWAAEPGANYVIQSSTNLADSGAWRSVDVAKSSGTIRWSGTDFEGAAKFYRVLTQPLITEVQPAFVDSSDSSAQLYLSGQLLPTNGIVVINGQNFSATADSNGVLNVSLNGLPPGTPVTGTISVLDAASNVVATLPVESPVMYGTVIPDELLQGPPTEPPASPQGLLIAFLTKKGYDYYQAQSALASTGLNNNPAFQEHDGQGQMPESDGLWLSKKGYDYYQAQSQLTSSRLAAALGIFASKKGYDYWQAQGSFKRGRSQDMDNSYDPDADILLSKKGYDYYQAQSQLSSSGLQNNQLYGRNEEDCDDSDRGIFPSTGEMRLRATDLAIPGAMLDFAWTRTYRSRTGPTTAQGAGWDFSFNVSLTQNTDGTITLHPGNGRADTFYPHGTNWIRDEYFCEIRDLNADGMPDVLFADTGKWLFHASGPASGKLAQIVDRNGNTINLNYDTAGRLNAIVDDLGRTNSVVYDTAGRIASVTDFSGRMVCYEYNTAGDLISVISPPITGTPTGNDFPGGITNRYTYTSGNTDDRLNHNLVSFIDGKGQTQFEVTYSPTNDPASSDYDTVISTQRGIEKKDIRRGMVIVKPSSHFATTKVIVRDALGNVTEEFYDSRQRCVRRLEYTGRATDLNAPTTETENRPVNKLRADDPDYFETQWTWNRDSLCTLETLPDGQCTQIIYERDFDSAVSARKKGDCRVVRSLAAPGGGADLDGDGVNDISELAWRFEYDPRFGSPPLNGVGGRKGWDGTIKGRPPEAGSRLRGRKGWDGVIYGTHRVADGDNTPIIKGSALGGMALRHKYKGWNGTVKVVDDAFVTRVTDPRGNVTTAEYDANGNATRYIRTFDRAVSVQDHADLALAYNPHGQLTAITNAPDGNGFSRVDTFSYYTNGPQAGQLQSLVIDDRALIGLREYHAFEYDAVGNLTRYVDPRTNDWLFTYTALDQCIMAQSPVNRTAHTTHLASLDASGNLTDSGMELRDENDVFIRNVTTHYDYDTFNRCTAIIAQMAPGSFITNRFEYDANDNLVSVLSPLAVSGEDPHAMLASQYDERGLLFRQIAAPGGPLQNTDQLDYDANGHVIRLKEGLEGTPLVTTLEYDTLGWVETVWNKQCVEKSITVRMADQDYNIKRGVSVSRVIDPMGNEIRFNYDRNGNCTLVRFYGETNDVPGGAGNILLAQSSYKYDGRDRMVQCSTAHFRTSGAPVGDGLAITTFAYAPNGACTSVTDDNGHTTSYDYDTAGRVYAIKVPNGKRLTTCARDAAGNVTGVTITDQPDGGGAAQQFSVGYRYDSLGRCTADWDNVGNTNRYTYDSLSRCVRSVNPNGITTWITYDDLDRCLAQKADSDGDGVPELTDATSSWSYDDNSRCVAATDANGNVTSYAYDSLGRCTTVTNADNTVMKLIWSPRSNLLSTEDPNGTTVTNTYNLRNNIVHRDLAARGGALATTTFENFAYDGLGRCVSAQNDWSTSTFAYDSLGNCTHTTQDGLTTTYTYDGVGNKLSMTYPSGRVVTYTYNEVDDVSSLSSSAAGGLPSTTLATYTYDGPGRLKGIARANGVNTALQWDGTVNPANAGSDFGWLQVRGISHAGSGQPIDQRRNEFDRNQNRVSRTMLAPVLATGLETNLFGYDVLDRQHHFINLKTSGVAAFQDLSLDNMGNRLAETNDSYSGIYSMLATLPPGDFQMNRYSSAPLATFNYDANGNLTVNGNAAGPMFYAYDYANRLVQVSAPDSLGGVSVVASYAYDALGRRISKTIYPSSAMEPPVTTYFVKGREQCDDRNPDSSDGCNTEERILGSTSTKVYCWGGSADFVCFNNSTSPQYAHCDDLGNLLALTDSGGAVLERYSYGTFGAPTFLAPDGSPKTGSDGVSPAKVSDFGMSRLFRGMEWEDAIGLYRCEGNPLYEAGNAGQNPLFDPQTGRATRGKVKNVKDTGGSAYDLFNGNPWSLKKEEGGRHTPFQNKNRPQYQNAKVSRNILKSFFEKGDKPSQAQFSSMIDSLISSNIGKHGSQRDYIPQSNFALEIN